LYKRIKRGISVELYVSMNMSKHLRWLFTQLRSATLPIEIETGRYYGITREPILRKQCHINVIENKQHFLFDCPKYITFRTTLHNIQQEANLDNAFLMSTWNVKHFFM